MGKTKAVKKPSSPLKISTTSLFKRKSKNSTGQVDKESASLPTGKSGAKGKVVKGKIVGKGKVGNKEGSKQSSSTTSSASSSPTSSSNSSNAAGGGSSGKKQLKKKTTTTATKRGSSEGKVTTQGKKKVTATTKKGVKTPTQSPVKGKPSKSDTTSKSKTSARSKEKSSGPKKDKDKSPSPKSRGNRRSSSISSVTSNSSSSSSNSSTSSSNTEESSSSTDDKGKKGSNKKKKVNIKKTKKTTTASEKVATTRKRSRSDADAAAASSPSSPVQQKMAKKAADEEGESTSGKKKGSGGVANAKNNKKGGKTSSSKTVNTAAKNATAAAKKVTKKAAASIVASKKKKLPVKLEKSSASSSSKSKAKTQQHQDKSKSASGKKMNKKSTTTASTAKGTKSKVKPRPKTKLKRMASLNAKAILEASFSFEPQEKKQRSPAPSSTSVMSKVKNMDDAATSISSGKDSPSSGGYSSNGKAIIGSSSMGSQKGNDDVVMSISVSTSTSPPPTLSLPPPPLSSSSSIPTPGKVSGERKRKSGEALSRRESIASVKSNTSSKAVSTKVDAASGTNHVISMVTTTTSSTGSDSKTGSRRNSTTVTASTGTSTESSVGGADVSKMSKKSKKESPSAKKKTKVTTATTSTSTSTSPLMSPEFYPEQLQQQPKKKQKHKKEKSRGVDSGTNTLVGDKYHQDCGIQIDHEIHQSQANIKQKSAGCQAKERKSSTPVAHFGTVYQPAGPLIEPHKTSSSSGSVPMGLLPETVKLLPDIKVTVKTHPPTSNLPSSVVSHSSSSKASKKHASSLSSSSTSTSSHHHHHNPSQKSSSSSLEKSSGQILHQPYKSSLSSSSSIGTGSQSSSSMPRPIQPSYPGVSYVSAATGSPLLSSSSSSILSQQQSAAAAAVVQQQQQQHLLHQQQLAGAGLTMTGHHHSLSSTGSSVGGVGIGPSQQPPPPSVSTGASSAGGLFYSSSAGFGPHHSPFGPSKYPMVPPESYRTQSPYQNSILYPPSTPQQQSQQSYFMTPFYTPPLTPNSTPSIAAVGSSGLGSVSVGASQPRPLSLAAHHHPSVAAASFYQPHSGLLPPSAHHHPSNYLVASPHHSIQPVPTAPGHAGLFHLNQSTQPACPCPTESYQLSSTSNNKPLQPQQCVSSVSLLAQEAGAKQPHPQSQQALACTTASRSSRNFNKVPHPPTCTTPALAADPPVTIQLLNSNIDVQKSQARQLESAKTFTEQYSLPDDITITPIIVTNPNINALVLMSPSISIVTTSAPTTSVTNSPISSSKTSTNQSPAGKKKEKDIVHVIDPRSGQKTTIAKHISNKNLLASNINKSGNLSPQSPNKNFTNQAPGTTSPVSRLKPNINKIGAVRVGKLNPDLDVIVINKSGNNRVAADSIIENVKLIQEQKQELAKKANKSTIDLQSSMIIMNANKNSSKKSNGQLINVNAKGKGNKGQIASRRVALADNDNNSPRKIAPKNKTEKPHVPFQPPAIANNSAFNYSLPPGISISPGVGTNLSITTTNLNTISTKQSNMNVRPMVVQNAHKSDYLNAKSNQGGHHSQLMTPSQNGSNSSKCPKTTKKRIRLDECIDGLQKKRQKLIDHGLLPNGGSPIDMVNGNPRNGKGNNSQVLYPYTNVMRGKDTATSARVRDPELNSNVINSSDAFKAVKAVVLDPETYHLTRSARASGASSSAAKGLNKNGLKKGKFQSNNNNKRKLIQSSSLTSASGKKSSSSLHPNATKVKVKPSEKAGSTNTRNTRSAAANAKIRTRLSTKPKLTSFNVNNPIDPNQLTSRGRSRLLRKRNQIIAPGTRKSESDCSSTNTSRSSSAVRIVSGSSGKLEKDRASASNKYPTQAFINAVAGLCQYRRNVMLRVPRAGVGIFPSASSVNLLNLSGSSSSSISNTGHTGKASLSPVQDKPKIQLSPGSQNVFHEYKSGFGGNTSRSSSPGLSGVVGNKHPVGSIAASAAKKRAAVKPLSPASVNGALIQLGVVRRQPKWSNGWRFEGDPYDTRVFLNNDDQPVLRRCYPAMRHESGDVIQTRDCVLLKSGPRKNDLPYIAKIAALWENPSDGEMMFSLLWYYRPEHTEMGRANEDMQDEIFASKHIDINSVATIDDRCYVLTFSEYCRYRKKLKQLEEGIPDKPLISLTGSSMINNNAAGNIANAVWSGRSMADAIRDPSSAKISSDVVFFCKKVYDFRQKRIKNPS